jgi:hypothetical protein
MPEHGERDLRPMRHDEEPEEIALIAGGEAEEEEGVSHHEMGEDGDPAAGLGQALEVRPHLELVADALDVDDGASGG